MHPGALMTPLLADGYLGDWLDLVLRWAHVVIAVTWIGTSIYFVRLDNHLRPPEDDTDREAGVKGEHWGAHGGGFYHVRKFAVTPPRVPSHLELATPWPAYATWLTGFSLFAVLYYANPRTYLIDPTVADLSPVAAVAISIGFLVVGWLVYDVLCRTLGRTPRGEVVLAVCVVVLVAVVAYAAGHLFSPRAAYLQVGAMLGTIMSANVLTVIMPGEYRLEAALRAGRPPIAEDGIRAKQRSVHNTYLTLPVLFAMLSNHFPFVYGHAHAWVVLLVIMAIGAWVRHFFVLYHQRQRIVWPMPATAAAAVAALAIWLAPGGGTTAPAPERVASETPSGSSGGAGAQPSAVAGGRTVFETAGCASCHSLKDARSSGTVGPDLDSAKPSMPLVVQRVTNGQGAMPPFRGRLSERQIEAVARYVSTVAGR